MNNGTNRDQIDAQFVRTAHSVWHTDWKIIIGVGILFAFKAALSGWKSAKPRRRTRRS
jgi:hypothetical protein